MPQEIGRTKPSMEVLQKMQNNILRIIFLIFLCAGLAWSDNIPKWAYDAKKPDPHFIILWVSTAPLIDWRGKQYAIEWMDRQSLRQTFSEAEEWVDILKKHGKGFNFRIYEAYLLETHKMLEDKKP